MKKLVPRDDADKESQKHKKIREECNNYINENLEPPISLQEVQNVIIKMKN